MNPLSITLTIRPALNGWIIEQQIGEQKPLAHAVTSAWGAVGQLARLMADWERMMAHFHKRACEQPYAAGIPGPDALDTISATYQQPPAPQLDTARIGTLIVNDLAEADRDAARRLAAAMNTDGPAILRAATQKPEPPAARPQPVAAPSALPRRGNTAARTDTARHADDAASPSSAQAPQPTPAAAEPRPPGRPPLASWTAARLALLPRYRTDDLTALLAEINALPGDAITMKALMNKASAKGVKREADAKHAAKSAAMAKLMADENERARRAASARAALAKARQPTPPPPGLDTETTIALPPAGPSALKERVRQAMAQGVDRWDIWAGQQKALLREVYRLRGEIEHERRGAA